MIIALLHVHYRYENWLNIEFIESELGHELLLLQGEGRVSAGRA